MQCKGTACEVCKQTAGSGMGRSGVRLYIPPSPEESTTAGCLKLACVLLKGSAAQPMAARLSRVDEDDAGEVLVLAAVRDCSRAGSRLLPQAVFTGTTPAAMAAERTCLHGRLCFRKKLHVQGELRGADSVTGIRNSLSRSITHASTPHGKDWRVVRRKRRRALSSSTGSKRPSQRMAGSKRRGGRDG